MSEGTRGRGQPLSLRLALVLSVVVVVVLLVTGVAVNRLVNRGLSDQLTAADRDRIAFAAASLSDLNLEAPASRRGLQALLRRLATATGGRVELVAGDGTLVTGAGTQIASGVSTQQISEAVPGTDLKLVITLRSSEPPFLRAVNLTLMIAGVLAVAALILASVFLADRLTRPLRGVAAAARRLGGGDLAARAAGGADRESRELADAFNTMADRLQHSETLRRRAASDMAHDLATPATVLESQLQAMVDGVVPPDREQLERARSAAGAMSGVIVQLRELVDAEAASLQGRPEPIAVRDLLDEVATTMAPLFRERGLTLTVSPTGPGLRALVDRGQGERALRNVLTNAAQHSPTGGTVTLGGAPEPRGVVVRVADEGTGIPAEDLPHIFERFYRADRSRRFEAGHGGSGIGLTIARELLRANGGEVSVERTGPAGTVFAILLRRDA